MATIIRFYDSVADEGIAHYLTDCGAGPLCNVMDLPTIVVCEPA